MRSVRQKVGLVFQNPEDQLFERYAGDDVAFGPRNLHLSQDEVRERVRQAMEAVGLPFAFKDRLTSELSQGEKRRLALAGVLALQPQVLVLDEPTAGLDRAGRDRVIAALRRRNAAGVTSIVVSHDVAFVAETAERVVVLRDGAVVADAPARALLSDAAVLAPLGLGPPPAAALGRALGLPGAPIRVEECAAALGGAKWRQA